MKNWVKTTLFLSAFSPLLISIAIARWWINGLTLDVFFYAATGIAGSYLSFSVMSYIERKGEILAFSAKKIESNDTLMLGMVGTYFIPFFGLASDITIYIVILLFVLGGLVFWLTTAIPPHPLLRFFKYRFYKAESERGIVYTLITKREIIDPKNVKQIRRISSSMIMEVT